MYMYPDGAGRLIPNTRAQGFKGSQSLLMPLNQLQTLIRQPIWGRIFIFLFWKKTQKLNCTGVSSDRMRLPLLAIMWTAEPVVLIKMVLFTRLFAPIVAITWRILQLLEPGQQQSLQVPIATWPW